MVPDSFSLLLSQDPTEVHFTKSILSDEEDSQILVPGPRSDGLREIIGVLQRNEGARKYKSKAVTFIVVERTGDMIQQNLMSLT